MPDWNTRAETEETVNRGRGRATRPTNQRAVHEELREARAGERHAQAQRLTMQREREQALAELEDLKKKIEMLLSPPLSILEVVRRLDEKDGEPSRCFELVGPNGAHFVYEAFDINEDRPEHIPEDKLFVGINPDDLEVGTRVAVAKGSAILEVMPSVVDEMISKLELVEQPTITYEDIGGLREQIIRVKETVELPLNDPERFTRLGVEPPNGVLMVGPPGTGKTLIAKAVANATNSNFIRVVGSELVQKYIGEGARMVRELFALARDTAPSIIFIDEIDAIGATRTRTGRDAEREVQRTLMQLLAELDGFEPLEQVCILGATNRGDILDEALVRPGRFDRIIEVPLPDRDARKRIFEIHSEPLTVTGTLDLERLARDSDGLSGADIHIVCVEAGMTALRDGAESVTPRYFYESLAHFKDKKSAGKSINNVMFM